MGLDIGMFVISKYNMKSFLGKYFDHSPPFLKSYFKIK
jgi:hypothetical protein